MVTSHSPGWIPGSPDDSGAESMAELLSSSRRLVRFWPTAAPGPKAALPKVASSVWVPVAARRVVAGMSEYDS
ncbi:hypothetical protein AB0K51_02570 [Kitasatospora sp. NPDC049285]|uniref:hypothetical protein n=1 Tax=Kitasatospora sp. NPDC049285 TaxID=3157096 RepID=UPI00344900EF